MEIPVNSRDFLHFVAFLSVAVDVDAIDNCGLDERKCAVVIHIMSPRIFPMMLSGFPRVSSTSRT